MDSMNDDHRPTFPLSDIRALRYLALVLGALAVVMLTITDRETPFLAIGFVTLLGVAPIAAIYFLRRRAQRRTPPGAGGQQP